MSTKLNFGRDNQGLNAYAPQFPTDIFTATLAAGTASSVVVPSNFDMWIMSIAIQPGGEVWVAHTNKGQTPVIAAVPVGGTFAAATSELNPGARMVNKGDNISVITANTTCDVEISFYAIGIHA